MLSSLGFLGFRALGVLRLLGLLGLWEGFRGFEVVRLKGFMGFGSSGFLALGLRVPGFRFEGLGDCMWVLGLWAWVSFWVLSLWGFRPCRLEGTKGGTRRRDLRGFLGIRLRVPSRRPS